MIVEQAGADKARVEEVLKRLELVLVEMQPGDGFLFHANLLHGSDQNRSNNPRWAMIGCHNAARNDPYQGSAASAGLRRSGDDEQAGTWLRPNHDVRASTLSHNE